LIKSTNGIKTIEGTKGPIAYHLDNLRVMLKVLFDGKNYESLPKTEKDVYWHPVEFSDEKYLTRKKLKIGKPKL
jgi:hypothetical protein